MSKKLALSIARQRFAYGGAPFDPLPEPPRFMAPDYTYMSQPPLAEISLYNTPTGPQSRPYVPYEPPQPEQPQQEAAPVPAPAQQPQYGGGGEGSGMGGYSASPGQSTGQPGSFGQAMGSIGSGIATAAGYGPGMTMGNTIGGLVGGALGTVVGGPIGGIIGGIAGRHAANAMATDEESEAAKGQQTEQDMMDAAQAANEGTTGGGDGGGGGSDASSQGPGADVGAAEAANAGMGDMGEGMGGGMGGGEGDGGWYQGGRVGYADGGETVEFYPDPESQLPESMRGQVMAPADPTIRQRMADFLATAGGTRDESTVTRRFGEGMADVVGMTPVGIPMAYEETKRAMRTGDYPEAALSAVGMIPGARPGAKAAVDTAKDVLARQSITSADTSIKQIPALFKSSLIEARPGHRNLDIGGGKYDLGTEHLRERGIESYVYDPFNRPADHNERVISMFKEKPADSVTAANVLNVIPEDEAMRGVIRQAYDNLAPGGTAYFGIYEGNRSGKGVATSKGFQRNAPASAYLEEIKAVFPDAERRGNVIIARRADQPSAEAAGMPMRVYHGTRAEDFPSFKVNPDEYMIDRALGVHVAKDPRLSDAFIMERVNNAEYGPLEGGRMIPLQTVPEEKFFPVPQREYEWAKEKTDVPAWKKLQSDQSAIETLVGVEGYSRDPELFARYLSQTRKMEPEEARSVADKLIAGQPVEHYGRVYKSVGDFVADFGARPFDPADKRRLVELARESLAEKGYAGLKYTNTSPQEMLTAEDPTSYIVFEPKNLRVPWAKFDPAEKESADLLKNKGGSVTDRARMILSRKA